MSTKAIRKMIEMFGGVPLAHYSGHGKDGLAYETWKAATAEVEAIRKAAKLYMQGWETADEARTLLSNIAKEAP